MRAQIDKETAGAGLLEKSVMMQVNMGDSQRMWKTESGNPMDQMAEDGKIGKNLDTGRRGKAGRPCILYREHGVRGIPLCHSH